MSPNVIRTFSLGTDSYLDIFTEENNSEVLYGLLFIPQLGFKNLKKKKKKRGSDHFTLLKVSFPSDLMLSFAGNYNI